MPTTDDENSTILAVLDRFLEQQAPRFRRAGYCRAGLDPIFASIDCPTPIAPMLMDESRVWDILSRFLCGESDMAMLPTLGASLVLHRVEAGGVVMLDCPVASRIGVAVALAGRLASELADEIRNS